ncbi:hypothetical protein OXYTRIMIC_042 [Oxytricha trifallax]|uniref:Uncharacterized protein n=1 Tax=Oxytricha trifallax TaxID=1172189 RepID=A0A073ICD8_9SPIT|nr:hypothetical protein OXYTRIMIC_042 [Oxytricha trifallax]
MQNLSQDWVGKQIIPDFTPALHDQIQNLAGLNSSEYGVSNIEGFTFSQHFQQDQTAFMKLNTHSAQDQMLLVYQKNKYYKDFTLQQKATQKDVKDLFGISIENSTDNKMQNKKSDSETREQDISEKKTDISVVKLSKSKKKRIRQAKKKQSLNLQINNNNSISGSGIGSNNQINNNYNISLPKGIRNQQVKIYINNNFFIQESDVQGMQRPFKIIRHENQEYHPSSLPLQKSVFKISKHHENFPASESYTQVCLKKIIQYLRNICKTGTYSVNDLIVLSIINTIWNQVFNTVTFVEKQEGSHQEYQVPNFNSQYLEFNMNSIMKLVTLQDKQVQFPSIFCIYRFNLIVSIFQGTRKVCSITFGFSGRVEEALRVCDEILLKNCNDLISTTSSQASPVYTNLTEIRIPEFVKSCYSLKIDMTLHHIGIQQLQQMDSLLAITLDTLGIKMVQFEDDFNMD